MRLLVSSMKGNAVRPFKEKIASTFPSSSLTWPARQSLCGRCPVCKIGPGQSQAADCGHRELAARPELVRPRRVRGEPRTRPLQPNLASGLSRERVEGRLALALRRLVSRHMGLRLVLVRFRFLFFLISFLSLRHGDPPVCSLDPPF